MEGTGFEKTGEKAGERWDVRGGKKGETDTDTGHSQVMKDLFFMPS